MNIYMDVLNEMDDEIRKIVMYDKKIEIEYFLGNNIIRRSKEWEELRTKHINDYSKVVVQKIHAIDVVISV